MQLYCDMAVNGEGAEAGSDEGFGFHLLRLKLANG